MTFSKSLLDHGAQPPTLSSAAPEYLLTEGDHHRKRLSRQWGGAVWWIGIVVLAVLAAILVRTYVVQSFVIPSSSMEPTLHGCAGCHDDRVLVDKLSYRLGSIRRGDVVVLDRPATEIDSTAPYLIKRVVGLSGETVRAQDGVVIVDDRTLIEPYLDSDCGGTASFAPVTVPAGEVFVMGDNRCNSSDSRVFGPIAKKSIVGRAFLRVWPAGRLHWL